MSLYNFGFFTLLEHTEMLLRLEGKAQREALAKTRRATPRRRQPITSEWRLPMDVA